MMRVEPIKKRRPWHHRRDESAGACNAPAQPFQQGMAKSVQDTIAPTIRQGLARPWSSRKGFGRFLPELAGGASRLAGLFPGGPVPALVLFIAVPFVFVAEPKGAWIWNEKVAEHRTTIFAEVTRCPEASTT